VVRLTIIRVLISFSASHGLLVNQMDIKMVFLHGTASHGGGKEVDLCLYVDDIYCILGQASK
jgi:hypothetical protein